MPDFNRPGMIRLSEAYRQKQKHIDAHDIGSSLQNYLRFPTTFDGNLPSEAFGHATSRVKIGQRYLFPDPDGHGELSGLVTSALVDETRGEAIIAVTFDNNKSYLMRSPMSESDMAEWKEFGGAFFANPHDDNARTESEFELFEWLMKVNKGIPREKMLAWFSSVRDMPSLEKLSDEDLLIAYCEGHVGAIRTKHRPEKGPSTPGQNPGLAE